MLLDSLDFQLRDTVIFALLAWFFYRHTWVMMALALMVAGAGALMILPADIYYSLLPLALIGCGLGMLLHFYQQRRIQLQRESTTPRTYMR